ncbi:MAG: fibronectin type III domain-containing protein [Cellulomonadaceae bacterium]|jgi:hypothetical protein|nr:fibronectin type III domain-containing protein [Cellulomonadaceae bacterium]
MWSDAVEFSGTTVNLSIRVPVAPSAPTPGEVSASTIAVVCPAVPEADYYEIQLASDAEFSQNVLTVETPNGEYTFTGLNPNTKYFVRCRGANAGGAGAWSPVVEMGTKPATPSIKQTSVTTTSWNLTCEAAGGADGYVIELATTANFATIAHTANQQSANFTGLSATSAYYGRCKASNSAGSSDYSAYISIPALPASPTLSTTALSSTAWSVSASTVAGATSYIIDRATSSAFTSVTTVNAQTAAWTGLTASQAYYARARAENSRGSSPYSTTLSIPALPATPGVPTATNVTTTGFTATCPDIAGAKTYVRYSTSSTMSNASAWATSPMTFSGLASNSTYYIQCEATNGRGTSVGSSASVTTLVVAITATPGFKYYGTSTQLVCTDNNSDAYVVLAASGSKPEGAECGWEYQLRGYWDPNGYVNVAPGAMTHPLYCEFQARARWFIGTNFGPWSQLWGRYAPEPGCV